MCNTILDHIGAPAYCRLLCLMYVCLVLNSSFSDNIKTIPLQLALSTTNDISPLLCFTFYQLVYNHMDDTPFPLDSHEHHGCWGRVSETIGNFMTFKICTDDTKKIIHHSNICSACDPASQNVQMDPINNEPPQFISYGEDL